MLGDIVGWYFTIHHYIWYSSLRCMHMHKFNVGGTYIRMGWCT